MRVAFCDDEHRIGELLENYLREWFRLKGLEQPEYRYYASGQELLNDTDQTDILFLDVEMPGISGIDVGKQLKERNPDIIIFMETSYLEYLDDAMRFHVFRYLIKPIEKDRLYRNMEDAMELYAKIRKSDQKVSVKLQDKTITLLAPEIVYIEAKNHRTYLYTRQEEYITWDSLEDWSERLDQEKYFRSHRSYIVNMEYVTKFSKNKIELCDGKYVAGLSANRSKAFKDAYGRMLLNVC